MLISHRHSVHFVCQSMLSTAALGIIFLTLPALLPAQSVPPALESPAAQPPKYYSSQSWGHCSRARTSDPSFLRALRSHNRVAATLRAALFVGLSHYRCPNPNSSDAAVLVEKRHRSEEHTSE